MEDGSQCKSIWTAFPCITAGANVVQIAYKAGELLDSIVSSTPIYEFIGQYATIYKV